MLTAPFHGGYRGPHDSHALVMAPVDGNAALAAAACSLEHASAATVRHMQFLRSSRHLSRAMLRWSNSMRTRACKCSYSAPRDSYVLVTPSLDGNAAFSATARSLQHASAATVRRATAIRSSRHLSMAMLRCQQQHAYWTIQLRLQCAM